MKKIFALLLFPALTLTLWGQEPEIPSVLSRFEKEHDTLLMVPVNDTIVFHEVPQPAGLSTQNFPASVHGLPKGFLLDFHRPALSGLLYIGLIDYAGNRFPLPVYRSRSFRILGGKVMINMDVVRGHYDMTGWEKSGRGVLGYRVINAEGRILYDGKIAFAGTGPFTVEPCILTGPFVSNVTDRSAVIWWDSDLPAEGKVIVEGKTFTDGRHSRHHEVAVTGLEAGQHYSYTVTHGQQVQHYAFETAPAPGSRSSFVFGYTSDSRGGAGWGERNLGGTNAYMVKRIGAAAAEHKVAFLQFTGDLISGYRDHPDESLLQYENFKHAIEPFAHYLPVVVGQGNHEEVMRTLYDTVHGYRLSVDRFPYATQSTTHTFSSAFVLPPNGPESEDGAIYDPDKSTKDFPPYEESVFWYAWDNVAMVSLNSNYWYTPAEQMIPVVGGNPHGYVMDKQLEWLKKVLKQLEKDDNIDHIFITIHTPFFPNSAHISDDMWYNGNNEIRPWIAGKPAPKGIIERRDQLLDLAVNKTKKVVALLTGDEHNYCKTELGPRTIIYPEGYEGEKITLKRTIYQINNGAAGAPYYAQAQVPWTPFTTGFSTQNALCLFYVDGKHIKMKVINPDTLEEIDSLELK